MIVYEMENGGDKDSKSSKKRVGLVTFLKRKRTKDKFIDTPRSQSLDDLSCVLQVQKQGCRQRRNSPVITNCCIEASQIDPKLCSVDCAESVDFILTGGGDIVSSGDIVSREETVKKMNSFHKSTSCNSQGELMHKQLDPSRPKTLELRQSPSHDNVQRSLVRSVSRSLDNMLIVGGGSKSKKMSKPDGGSSRRGSGLSGFFLFKKSRAKEDTIAASLSSRSSRSQSLDDVECILRMQERNFTDRRNGPVIINHGREVKDDLFSPSSRESSPTKPDKITLNNQGVKKLPLLRKSSSCGSGLELLHKQQQQVEATLPKSRTIELLKVSSSMETINFEEDAASLKSSRNSRTGSRPSLEEMLQHFTIQGSSNLQSQLKTFQEEMPACWMDIVENSEKLSDVHHELQSAIWELISNELGNIRVLRLLHYFYCKLIQLQDMLYLIDVNPDVLFGNIKEVLDACEGFWHNRLRRVYTNSRDSGNLLNALDVNEAFLSFSDYFEPYVSYCVREKMALSYLNNLKRNQKSNTFVQWCQRHAECERQELFGLLNRPTQQMTRYQLLLERVMSKSQSPMTKRALHDRIAEVKDFVMLINDTARLEEEANKVLGISNLISGYQLFDNLPHEAQFYLNNTMQLNLMAKMPGVPSTVCQQRVLIRQGSCGLLKRPTKEMRGFVYLLTDVLLITITVKGGNRKQKLFKQPMYLDRLQIGLSRNPACFLLMYCENFGFEYVVDAVWVNVDSSKNAKEWQRDIADAQENYQRLQNGQHVKSHPRLPGIQQASVGHSARSSDSDQPTIISPQGEMEAVHSNEQCSTSNVQSHSLARSVSAITSNFVLPLHPEADVPVRAKKVSLTSLSHISRPVSSDVSSFSHMSCSASSDGWSRYYSSSDEDMPENQRGINTLPAKQVNEVTFQDQSQTEAHQPTKSSQDSHMQEVDFNTTSVTHAVSCYSFFSARKQGRDENGMRSEHSVTFRNQFGKDDSNVTVTGDDMNSALDPRTSVQVIKQLNGMPMSPSSLEVDISCESV
ncbi:uncharacterized protein LOC134181833 isoform X2 [Corticium candelabrum]|uniref:uncharacterized protein LOC134181833 isoform X2 n=1 Tax=Corticium candelabrum TaxID=121492 RepID=UPI002E2585E3|nr:uncharacterized protein LOC134181833 isoform X2 [Corticium candelabrum]